MSRVVLAYSGGLDTSVLLKKLIDSGNEVIAMTANLGESDHIAGEAAEAALEGVRRKALTLGAKEAVLLDVRERFIKDYCQYALRANALYEGVYPLSASLSRPLLADLLVETAHEYHADAVAHGCTGKGNDQVRIEVGVRARAPELRCIAPLRDEPMSRPDAIAYAQAHNVPIPHTIDKPFSVDANLWGRSIEAGVLENPWTAPPEEAYAWTKPPSQQPSVPTETIVDFNEGVPSIEGVSGAKMLAKLNGIAGAHGFGRLDLIEDRVVGLKSREVYECPGSLSLIAANKALERLVLTRDELRVKAGLDQKYAELIYDGLWSSPLRGALNAFNEHLAARMTGSVRLSFFHGQAVVTGSRSPFALYDEGLATYGAGDTFKHDAATGFIEIFGLPVAAGARTAGKSLACTS
ncbi:MAG: argininosuccinate synthase [Candidatus Eremiobacteraeota bacterium]|nr:argininosuccinate synthase [Candidatus Eremiobacteraeota bacterium]